MLKRLQFCLYAKINVVTFWQWQAAKDMACSSTFMKYIVCLCTWYNPIYANMLLNLFAYKYVVEFVQLMQIFITLFMWLKSKICRSINCCSNAPRCWVIRCKEVCQYGLIQETLMEIVVIVLIISIHFDNVLYLYIRIVKCIKS